MKNISKKCVLLLLVVSVFLLEIEWGISTRIVGGIVSLLGGTSNSSEVQSILANSKSYVADNNTMDNYINFFNLANNSRAAGRVWADKTVSKGAITLDMATDGYDGTITNNSEFLHVYSLLGSSQVDNTTESIPMDVIFVIDVSASMGGSATSSTGKTKADSRIGKVVQSMNEGIDYLMKINGGQNRVGIVVYGSYAAELLPLGHYTANSGNEYITLTSDTGGDWRPGVGSTQHFKLGTNVKEISEAKEVTNCGSNTNPQSGIWMGLKQLFTAENTVYTTFTTKTKISRQPILLFFSDGGANAISKGEWYNPNDTGYGADGGSSNHNDDLHQTLFEANTDTNHSAENGSTAILQTLMTASYAKSRVEHHYAEEAQKAGISDAPVLDVYSFGIDTASIRALNTSNSGDRGAWATPRLNAIMDPSRYFQATDTYTYPNNMTSQAKASTENVIANAYSQWQNWINNQTASLQYHPGRSTSSLSTLEFPQLPSDNYNGVSKSDIIKNINFVPLDHFHEVESENLSTLFSEILQKFSSAWFKPVAGNNDAGFKEAVSYIDPVGKYMEVKDVRNVLLFGTLYNVKKDKIVYYTEQVDGQVTESETKPEQYSYSRQYYKIESSNNEIENPCYNLKEGGEKVTFKLSEIDIYVEKTNGHADTEIGKGIESDSHYDEALHINVPTNAIPLQVATIEVNTQGNVSSYTTNVNSPTMSTPLRVFYDVGIADEFLTEDRLDIDLGKLSEEYIEANKDSNGDLYFYSNWYVKDKKYEGYSTAGPQEYGDTVVSFSPSIDNRFYVFQRALPLYEMSNPSERYSEIDLEDEATYQAWINSHQQITDPSKINSDSWYYIVIDYYKAGSSKPVHVAVARKGNEFGSAIAGDDVKSGEYLCWYSAQANDWEPYSSTKPSKDGINDWVVATKPGGIRVGNMANSIQVKSTNPTRTSRNYYVPTISNSTKPGDQAQIVINNYLGNNGRLSISDATLMLTKEVTSSTTNIPKEEFNYTLNVETKEGDFKAILLRKHEEHWDYLFDNVTVMLDTEGFLLSHSGNRVETTYNGKTVYMKYSGNQDIQNQSVLATEKDGDIQEFEVPVKYYEKVGYADADDKPITDTIFQAVVWKTAVGESENGESNQYADLYWTNSTFKTVDIKFGYSEETKARLGNKPDGWTDEEWNLPAHTAKIKIKGNEGILINGITVGAKYTVEEEETTENNDHGFYFEKVEGSTINGLQIEGKKASGTISSNVRDEVHYTNRYISPVDLTITKTIRGEEGDRNRDWQFTLTLTPPAGKTLETSYNYTGTRSGTLNFTKNQSGTYTATFTLKDSETITIQDLPNGTEYDVEENGANQEGYVTTFTNNKGTLTEDKTVAFYNTKYSLHNLIISKQVTGDLGETNKDFTFVVTLTPASDVSLNSTYHYTGSKNGDMTFNRQEDGSYTGEITLKSGETITIENIPERTTYKVEETEANKDGYITQVDGNATGTFANQKDETITFTNIKYSLHKLKISKEVTGNQGEKEREWTFKVTLTPDEGVIFGTTYHYTGSKNGDVTFNRQEDGSYTGEITLKSGETITIEGIPERTSYQVEELKANQDGYITKTQGNPTGKFTNQEEEVIQFINTKYSLHNLKISKEVVGNWGEQTKDWKFKITLTPEEDVIFEESYHYSGSKEGTLEFTKQGDESYVGEITLKSGETITIEGIPERTSYQVEEVEANQDGYTTKTQGHSTGKFTNQEEESIQFTNTKYSLHDLKISKQVAGDLGERNKDFTFVVTLTPAIDVSLNQTYHYTGSKEGTIEFKKQENASYIGKITLKSGETITIEDIPERTTYKVEEVEANQNGYITQVNGNATGTFTSQNEETITFTNTKYSLHKLSISKEVIGNQGEKEKDWTFKVTLKPEEDVIFGTTYRYSGSKEGTLEFTKQGDGSYIGEITLKSGESVAIEGIPERTTYKVEEVEANQDGYITQVNGNATGKFDSQSGENIKFTNIRYSLHNLKISKEVTGNLGEKDKKWTFKVTLKPEEDVIFEESYHYSGSKEGTLGFKKQNDGSYIGEITLKSGETITIEDIPERTSYKVEEVEANQNGYITQVNGNTTGKFNSQSIESLQYVNIRYSLHNLNIRKEVVGNLGEKDKNWTFKVTLKPESDVIFGTTYRYSGSKEGTLEFKKQNDGSYIGEITLKSGETITIEDIPERTTYKVEEVEANQNGYITQVTGNTTGKFNTQSTESIYFTNIKYSLHDLNIRKEVVGNLGEQDRDFVFKVTLIPEADVIFGTTYHYSGSKEGILKLKKQADGSYIGEITLKSGETITIENIPERTTYKVEEIGANQEGYITKATNESGKLEDDITDVSFVNAKYTTNNLSIEKIVSGNLGSNAQKWTFEITLKPTHDVMMSESYHYVGSKEGDLIFTKHDDGTYTSSVVLSGGEKITIQNIPYGTEYSVKELEENTDGYFTSYQNAQGVITENEMIVSVENNRDGNIPNTNDDIRIHIILLLVSLVNMAAVIRYLLKEKAC